jgi:hypothetical protein
MSNNAAGRAIRPIAPCGKIHFAGSGARGPRAAIISILVESAKLNRKSLNLNFQSLRKKSQRTIHLLAASLASGSQIIDERREAELGAVIVAALH